MTRRFRGAVLAGIIVGYPALLVTALVPLPELFLVLLAAVLALEVWVALEHPYALPEALRRQLAFGFRVFSADVLSAVLAARVVDGRVAAGLALVAVFVLLGARDAIALLDRRIRWLRAGGPVSWSGLRVPGLPAPRYRDEDRTHDVAATVASLLLPIGATLSDVLHSTLPLRMTVLVLLSGVVVLVGVRGAEWRRAARRSPPEIRLAVRDAIVEHAPQVVLHYSGRRRTTDQAEMWIPTLARLQQPVLVLVRELHHLEALGDCGVPVVFAPASTDVELFSVESIRLVLYPTNTANINNHQIRVPGIFDVLVGTGDSDEPQNASPIARAYDEVWVSGPLGRRRYASPLLDVPDAHVREIGAPPAGSRTLGAPAGLATTDRAKTVLYAPTWEGTQDRVNRSSLPVAARMLDTLLALPDTRVLFAPPPAAGARLPEYEDLADAARDRVERAGAPHAVVDRQRIAAQLADVDLVVCDVSSVIADALAADVPYAVPMRPGETEAAIRAAFPTLAGGAVFDTAAFGGELLAASADRGEARRRLADDVLGTGQDRADPAAFQVRFQEAVDAALAQQSGRRSFVRPPVTA